MTTIGVMPKPSVVLQTDFAPYAGSSRLSTSSRLSPTPSPSWFVSEADTHASHLHEVEFSSDDDSYEFDHLEYPEDDENIEITSARFSVGTGYISNGYDLPGRYRDREGSIATLKTLRKAISNSLVDTNGQPSMFTLPFESSSPVTETVLVAAPTSSTSPTHATDTDFDLAYITSFGADISPDFVRRPSVISISAPNRDQSHTPRKN
ncbi:hypothetical protein BDP27DRAFT_1427905 [Rhodocollybia butyracea]|uniref:Uncharacterized protein n=1 Tax=Rhodocollybia butyracea TaxID=206335 RepID=A0A9P5U1I3_9AGAR|nr:hypothetical protein BDP27DRAFT_1427905 [Rhodocollybia butyracea]